MLSLSLAWFLRLSGPKTVCRARGVSAMRLPGTGRSELPQRDHVRNVPHADNAVIRGTPKRVSIRDHALVPGLHIFRKDIPVVSVSRTASQPLTGKARLTAIAGGKTQAIIPGGGHKSPPEAGRHTCGANRKLGSVDNQDSPLV